MRSMFTYMDAAPSMCRSMIQGGSERVGGLVGQYCAGAYRRILIVASGSSYNIAMASKAYIQRLLDVEVAVMWPMTYILCDHNQGDDTFVICMSQSGKSTNTIEAVRCAKSAGQDVCALTCNGNAPIHDVCESVYEYGSGADDYYVAKGFPTSCAFLFSFAIEAALELGLIADEDADRERAELLAVVESMPAAIRGSREFFARHRDALIRARRIMCVGIGAGYGIALEGALKLNEMTGIAANAYEMEEFVHGPTYEIRKDHVVFLVDLGDVGHARMMQLHDALGELTDHVYVIDATGEHAPEKSVRLESPAHGACDAMRAVIPFQAVSEEICSDLDMLSYNLSNFDFEQKMKTKA